MRHRPHDSQSICNLCRPRKTFANVQSRQRGWNRLHLALDFRGGFGLWIERLMLRW